MTFWNFGHVQISFGKINKQIMKTSVFFEHGKDAHRDFEKGALNESSRSLIWSFWEQIVFLEICEQVSKVSKLDQFWIHPRWSNKTLEICQRFGEFWLFIMIKFMIKVMIKS